jgi:hypothetical protein
MLGSGFLPVQTSSAKSVPTYFLKKTKRMPTTGIKFQSEAFIWNKQVKVGEISGNITL